nr:hypothetical protein [Arthrospira sp. PLM2.Bin9]
MAIAIAIAIFLQKPQVIETMPLSQINEAMDKVAANQARYRIVLLPD